MCILGALGWVGYVSFGAILLSRSVALEQALSLFAEACELALLASTIGIVFDITAMWVAVSCKA